MPCGIMEQNSVEWITARCPNHFVNWQVPNYVLCGVGVRFSTSLRDTTWICKWITAERPKPFCFEENYEHVSLGSSCCDRNSCDNVHHVKLCLRIYLGMHLGINNGQQIEDADIEVEYGP